MSYRLAGLAAALLLAFSTHAQTPAAAPVPATTVLKAAHLFDGRSGALVSPGLVVVRGSRILAVGANVAIPAGANVIELGDATLVPGYIDAHTHIAYDHDDDWAQGFYERSEAHTYELQSLMRISYAVFCLKKKIPTYKQTNHIHHS